MLPKILLAQPANTKFSWELDVLLTNIRSLSTEIPILLLFLEENSAVVNHFRGRYPNVEIYVYPDARTQKHYLPTIRPYLCWRYFSEHPEASDECYFQIDSDVIFRELPDFSKMPIEGKVCWASDCSNYIDYHYLISCQRGAEIVDKFSEILNIPVDLIKSTPGGGAQWIINKPTAGLWWHIWMDSQLLYDALSPVESNIQKWTAEMWAQLYNLAKFSWSIKISPELDFCRPTDTLDKWDRVKILHNAGVTGEMADKLFYKGKYLFTTPFKENLSWVDPTKISSIYVKAIKKVVT